MSEPDSSHMDETTLLTYADGELDASEAAEVKRHLAGCDDCRARLSELRSDLDDLITRHRERKISTARLPAAWADLRPEFDRLDGRSRRRIPYGWVGVAAAALVAGIFWNISNERTVSAAELLDKASRAASPEPGRRIAIQTRRHRFVRSARLEGRSQDSPELQNLFRQANFSWEDPFSARSFAAWRNQLPQKEDRVDSDGKHYRIRTTTSANALSEAVLTVRASDLRPVRETLRFKEDLVEITEAVPAPTVTPQVPGTRIATAPLTEPVALSAADELRVLSALNTIGADLGEPIEVKRDGEKRSLTIAGVGVNMPRQQQVREAVRDIPGIVFDFKDPQPLESTTQLREGPMTATRHSALHSEMERKLGSSDKVEQFVDTIVAESESALARAHALRKLAARFPPDVEQTLSPGDRQMLTGLRGRHLNALLPLSRSVEARLEQVFEGLDSKPDRDCGPDWQECAGPLLSASQRFDQVLNGALAGAGTQTAPDVSGLKAALANWRRQIEAFARRAGE